jgi:hypothetical protein
LLYARAVRLTSIVLVLAGLTVLGCGSRSGVAADGGADADTKVTGRHSFDVVATLAVGDGGFGAGGGLPATNAFTLVLDADAQQAIVGGKGHGGAVAATTTDGRTFHLGAFSTGVKSGSACEGASTIDYKSLDVTVSGTTLRGQASGSAQISCGDCFFNVQFTADVAGGPDVTAPSLSLSGGGTTDPFARPFFIANEPLPATAKAKISTGAGASVDLVPFTNEDDPSIVLGFSEPNVLPGAAGFTVAFDGLTDFAGHTGAAGPPLRLDGFAPPPLIAEDGFESVTATHVDGAAVIGVSAPVAPISGKQSVYIGGMNAPAIPGATFGQSLDVRLAVQPGDTRVHFSYRTISTLTGAVAATVDVGSVGHAPGATQIIMAQATAEPVVWVDGRSVSVSGIVVQEISLPPDVTNEVVVSIRTPSSANCGFPGPTPPPTGLELDDFVVE